MSWVIDASVLMKWLVPEAGSETAAWLLKQPVSAPELILTECLNALRKKVARQELNADEAARCAALMGAAGIAFEPVQPLAAEVLELSLRLDHPAYDCAYLAIARRLGGVLVTADARFVERCRRPDARDLAALVLPLPEVRPQVSEPVARPYRGRRAA